MRRIPRKTAIAALAAAGVLGVGIAAPTIALAEGKEPFGTSGPGSGPADHRKELRAAHQDALAEALAAELGIPEEKVAEALKKVHEQLRAKAEAERPEKFRPEKVRPENLRPEKVRPDGKTAADRQALLKERLDKAVAAGSLTREEADAVLKAAEAGVLPLFGHREFGLKPGGELRLGPKPAAPGDKSGPTEQKPGAAEPDAGTTD